MSGVPWQEIEGWFDFADVYDNAIGRAELGGAVFVEVGTAYGKSARYMGEQLERASAMGGKEILFFSIDWYREPEKYSFQSTCDRMGDLCDRYVFPIECESVEASTRFADESLDFVFLDGGHELEQVIADLAAWWPKIKRGGQIAGHDYTPGWPGVVAAVDDRFGPGRRISRSSWGVFKSPEGTPCKPVSFFSQSRSRAALAQR